jgi:glycosyltransferase involved in cell wall biosynthesis
MTGGVNQVVHDLYAGLARGREFRPVLFISSWDEPKPTPARDDCGRELVRMRMRAPFANCTARARPLISYLMRMPLQLWRILRVTRDCDVQVVNFHYVTESAFSWALLKRLRWYRVVLLFSFHGTDLHDLCALTGMRRVLVRWMLRQADRLLVCSNAMEAALRESFGVATQRIGRIYNGVDVDFVLNAVAKVPAGVTACSGERLIVAVGSYLRVKGHDLLVEAFAGVHAAHPDTRLLIVGRTGSELVNIQAAIHAARLEDSVELIRDVSHESALRLLAGATLFVMASRREGLPIAILEAGALAKPVVATAVGGIPEVIRDGIDGLLVPPESPDALERALCGLLAHPERARNMGLQLRERVLESFTVTRMATRYLEESRALSHALGFGVPDARG